MSSCVAARAPAARRDPSLSGDHGRRHEQAVPISHIRAASGGLVEFRGRRRRSTRRRQSELRRGSRRPASTLAQPVALVQLALLSVLLFAVHQAFAVNRTRVRPRPAPRRLLNLNMNDVRMTADGAVLDIFLARPGRQIDRNDDFLAAGVADVAGFFRMMALPVEAIVTRTEVRMRRRTAMNLFANLPSVLPEELVETVLQSRWLTRIERHRLPRPCLAE